MDRDPAAPHSGLRLGLSRRLALIVVALCGEKLLLNHFVDSDRALAAQGVGELFRTAQHWGFRFLVAFCAAIALLAYAQGGVKPAKSQVVMPGVGPRPRWLSTGAMPGVRPRPRWLLVHGLSVACLIPLSYYAYREGVSEREFVGMVTFAVVLGVSAILSAGLAMAPLRQWTETAAGLGMLWFYALVIAVLSIAVGEISQDLWRPAAAITFWAVRIVLSPVFPALQSDPTTRILGTDRFAVEILESCSGLEGMALMTAFICGWMIYFRSEYAFPRALVLVPLGLLVMFALNVLRIAALLIIGHIGFPGVAQYGFHSQAGWLAFIGAACAMVLLSRRLAWLSGTRAADQAPRVANPATPFVLPLVTILLVGMLTHAASSGFEELYPLRLLAGAVALWFCRKPLAALDWRFSWRGVATGVFVYAGWFAAGHFLLAPVAIPPGLAALSPGSKEAWMCAHALASIVTVPLAEELGYRGYLMRRLTREEFETLPFQSVRFPAVVLTAVVFGLGHGALWLPGVAAGLAYAAVLVLSGRMGEAVAAHTTSNALIAVSVLAFGRWEFW